MITSSQNPGDVAYQETVHITRTAITLRLWLTTRAIIVGDIHFRDRMHYAPGHGRQRCGKPYLTGIFRYFRIVVAPSAMRSASNMAIRTQRTLCNPCPRNTNVGTVILSDISIQRQQHPHTAASDSPAAHGRKPDPICGAVSGIPWSISDMFPFVSPPGNIVFMLGVYTNEEIVI